MTAMMSSELCKAEPGDDSGVYKKLQRKDRHWQTICAGLFQHQLKNKADSFLHEAPLF